MNKNESKYFNTAKKMNDALITLLDKKDFSYITVKDICTIANVNRSTFYLHYQNTSDLLEEVIHNLKCSFYEHFKEIKKSSADDELSNLIFIKDEYLLPYLNFIKENRRVYRAVKKYSTLFLTDNYTKSVYSDLISKILTRFNVDDNYKECMFSYYINGLGSMILLWCENDCNIEIHDFADLIKGLILNDWKNKK